MHGLKITRSPEAGNYFGGACRVFMYDMYVNNHFVELRVTPPYVRTDLSILLSPYHLLDLLYNQ